MDLKKKFNHLILLMLLVLQAVICPLKAQSTQPWTDDAWKEKTNERIYSEEEKKKADTLDSLPNVEEELNEWSVSENAKLIILVIFIVLLIGILVYLFINRRSLNERLLTVETTGMQALESRLIEVDPDQYLIGSIDAKDYKTAVRILYLKLIRELHLRKKLIWKKDKTNRDFIYEMRKHPQYENFRDLTLAYEIVWYGDSTIREDQFNVIQGQFSTFFDQIKRG